MGKKKKRNSECPKSLLTQVYIDVPRCDVASWLELGYKWQEWSGSCCRYDTTVQLLDKRRPHGVLGKGNLVPGLPAIGLVSVQPGQSDIGMHKFAWDGETVEYVASNFEHSTIIYYDDDKGVAKEQFIEEARVYLKHEAKVKLMLEARAVPPAAAALPKQEEVGSV